MTLTLVSFGTQEYVASLEYLRYCALRKGGFDRVILLGPDDLAPLNTSQRGYGSFAWKPKAILAAMSMCSKDDWLVYMDSTVCCNCDFSPALATAANVVLFGIGDAAEKGYTQAKYTKPDCMRVMGATEQEHSLLQLNAAVQAYRVCDDAREFVELYDEWCQEPLALEDEPTFPSHRHDQSILTLLAYRATPASVAIQKDPTQYGGQGALLDHHRRILPPMPTIVVVTPTTGDVDALARSIDSVQQQDVICLRHLIVCDGPAATAKTQAMRKRCVHGTPVEWLDLPYNTGAKGWNGHRIYAAATFLAKAAHNFGPAELIAFLDEDNWYSPPHLSGLLSQMLDGGYDATFSLRAIYDTKGGFVCNDCSESLGNFAPASLGSYFLADTSCWLLKHQAAVDVAACWDVTARDPQKPEADRDLTVQLLSKWKVGGVAAHTLNYVAGSSQVSVQPSYFEEANRVAKWDFAAKPCIYLFHFSAARTAEFMSNQHTKHRSFWLDEWNMNQCRALHRYFNVVDGFACGDFLPSGATVLIHMCIPQELPVRVLQRTDIHRLLYTAESPNIRHQQQWKLEFLQQISDEVITYWRPMLASASLRTHRFPHQCHFWDEDNKHDTQQLRSTDPPADSVCMVLENRRGLEFYEIDGNRLQCLDGLRAVWARRLAQQNLTVTVHGRGWGTDGPWTVGGTAGKQSDTRHAVDIIQNFAACLIVENCSAEGYVSEKFYDALMAGAVPLFYNGHQTDLPSDIYFNLATEPVSQITAQAIQTKRARLLQTREAVLRRTSAQAYASCVRDIVTRSKVGPGRQDTRP